MLTQTRTTFAVLLLTVFLLLRRGTGMFRISRQDLALSALIGTLGFYFHGLRYLDATRAVITSCFEPVCAVLLAAIFLHEALRGPQVAGIAAVSLATVMIQMRQSLHQAHF